MAIRRNGAVARQLSSLFDAGPTGDLTDGQLLERFAGRSGEPAELAFATLVERHGSLVLRVCRSVLRDEHQAHDAFQATFLVLVDKAGSLWVCDSLAPWLHAVAYRVALCARGSAARRRKHERRHAEAAGPPMIDEARPEAQEVGAVLHEEIDRLPERYRVPIVLCDLEGRSHDEAARHLGWPVGTVKSRQARGRDRLRLRLVRRGVAPSLGLGLAIASGPVARGAAMLPCLAHATAVLAARTSATGVLAASARVSSLTKEVLMGILLGKLKWAGTFLLAFGLVASGAWGIRSRASGGIPTTGRARAVVPAMVLADALREGPGKIYVGDGEGKGLVAIDPKTGEVSKILIEAQQRARISPDGKLIAYEWKGAVWVRALDQLVEPTKLLDLEGAAFGTPAAWSLDSSKLIMSIGRRVEVEGGGHWRFKTVRINVDGSGREDVPIPDEDGVQGWSPEGWLLTTSSRNAKIGWQLYVMKPDGTEQRQVTEGGNPFYTRFSPDGKRILYSDGTTEERRGIWVVGFDGQDRRKVLSTGKAHASACWSPDGKRIAVISFDVDHSVAGQPSKGRLVILDVDGDARTEFPLEDLKQTDMPDWR